MATPKVTNTKKAPKLFDVRRKMSVAGNNEDRILAGTLRDYLTDEEVIDTTISNNAFEEYNPNDKKHVTIKLEYEDSVETGEYGLLLFSYPLSKEIQQGKKRISEMLDYDVQKQLLWQDKANTIPVIDDKTGLQVENFTICQPQGGARTSIKGMNLDAKASKKASNPNDVSAIF
jgi:hypothetical protein